jgi:hypothetical protein
MVERQPAHPHVIAKAEALLGGPDVRENIVVGQQHAFGASPAAGRELAIRERMPNAPVKVVVVPAWP